MSLFDKWEIDKVAMLEERGITEDEWHREIMANQVEYIKAQQQLPYEDRIKWAMTRDEGDSILSLASAIVREYVGNEIIVLNDEEYQLADDLEQAECDNALLDNLWGLVDTDAINARRAEVFKRLGEMLPALWY